MWICSLWDKPCPMCDSKLPAIHHHSTRRSTWRLLPPTRLGDLFDWGLCHISIVSVVSVITLTHTGSGQFTRRIPSTVGLPGRFKQGPQKWSTDEASGNHGTSGLQASLYQSHKLLLLQIEGSVAGEPSNFWSNVHRYAPPHHLQLPSTSSSALVKWLLQLACQAVSHTRTSAPMHPLGPSPVTRKLWKLLISKILITEVYILMQRRNQGFWFGATLITFNLYTAFGSLKIPSACLCLCWLFGWFRRGFLCFLRSLEWLICWIFFVQ